MKKIMKRIAGFFLAMAIFTPLFTSCFDDSEIWDALGEMNDRIAQLENDLRNQAEAMSSLLSDGSTVSKCEKQEDGSYVITLSNGTKFKVLPAGVDFSSLMTYKEVGGEKCWAIYDPTGKIVLLTDKDGNNIPVSVKVEVKAEDNKYYVVVNGVKYLTGYDVDDMVQMYESCTPHTDASGNVYALTFSFGEGLDLTVSVDGYKGVLFKVENAGAATLVSDYYIPFGTTQTFLLDKAGVMEYAPLMPDGWRSVERVDKMTGNTYLDVTAPSRALVESGVAFEQGDLRAVAVIEGGNAAITKICVSAVPFKNIEFSSTRIVAEPYTGVAKFVYGVIPVDTFDETEVIANVETIITTNADPAVGYKMSEAAVNQPLEDILGAEPDPGVRYVAFVVPALYDLESESVYYVDPELLYTYEFGAIVAKMSEPVVSLFDAEISVEVRGTDKMWAGTSLKVDGLLDDILYAINNGIMDPVSASLQYAGSVKDFPTADVNSGLDMVPETTYVTWFVPFDPEKTTYSEDDIVYREYTTTQVVPGGNINVTAGEAVVSTSTITIPLSAEGAEIIYYAFLTESEGKKLGTVEGFDEQKYDYIKKSSNCTLVKGSEAVASITGITPESSMWLYAVAVDSEGKYGTVKCISSTLEKVKFNSLSVSYESWEIGSDKIEYKMSVSGGTPTGYLYWIGTTFDPFWVKSGKTRQGLEKYMATYPDDEAIAKVMRANGEISADGTITITGLRLEETYVMMVLAQDETGAYSKGAYKQLTTLGADLGVVRGEGSDLWESAKEQIQIDWIQEAFQPAASQAMMARYAFNFSCPQDYTAFILCASDTYFEDAGFTKKTQIMIELENYCSRRYDDGRTPFINGEYACEPDYYKDGELREGQMMNVVDFYVHGLPTLGFATYFAPGSHGEGNCIYWEDGHDVNYQRALDLIEEYKTITKYEARAAAFGLKGQEAADWAAALLEAYLPFYEDAKPLMYFNEGGPLYMMNPYAMGIDDKGEIHDSVVVMLKDRDGNYFEPMYFPVPNYFEE